MSLTTLGKPYKKIIFLVIAHNKAFFNELKQQWLRYINKCPNEIKVYFIYGKTDLIPNKEYDLIFPNIEENYRTGLTLKTIAAMEWVNQNWDYAYLVRTNLSSFWDFYALLDSIKNFPRERFYAGPLRTKMPRFIGGNAVIMSKDVAHMFTENKSKIPLYKDDVIPMDENRSFSSFAWHVLGLTIADLHNKTVYFTDLTDDIMYNDILDSIRQERMTLSLNSSRRILPVEEFTVCPNNNPYHFRIKNIQSYNRKMDIVTMNLLYNEIYKNNSIEN